ncbi:CPBP family intramembrane glutamic endopeptidase [Actinomadura atramentaria]|uniref:CPBP family intramembrane glutamic endopeptidase n=1 Tax=Actinomadura atramentaria TaxID=1990 RepID=UPI00036BA681|nr:CPBP family intramembrane glutamic endopeptidase [Actinomadura atramentaria]
MHFSVPALVLAALLTVHLAVVEPLLGRREHARLVRTRERDAAALTRVYARWIGRSWAWVAVAAAIVLLSPGVSWADLGLRAPDRPGLAYGLVGGAAVATALAARFGRPPAAIGALLPRTRRERGAGLAMAATAGTTEEIVFRGLLIALFTAPLGGTWPAAAAALAVFTVGHLYQGVRALPPILLLGLLLTWVYVKTGSLFPVMALHVLMDVRGLALTSAPTRTGTAAAPVPAR